MRGSRPVERRSYNYTLSTFNLTANCPIEIAQRVFGVAHIHRFNQYVDRSRAGEPALPCVFFAEIHGEHLRLERSKGLFGRFDQSRVNAAAYGHRAQHVTAFTNPHLGPFFFGARAAGRDQRNHYHTLFVTGKILKLIEDVFHKRFTKRGAVPALAGSANYATEQTRRYAEARPGCRAPAAGMRDYRAAGSAISIVRRAFAK